MGVYPTSTLVGARKELEDLRSLLLRDRRGKPGKHRTDAKPQSLPFSYPLYKATRTQMFIQKKKSMLFKEVITLKIRA